MVRQGFKVYQSPRMNAALLDAPIFVAGHRGLVGSAIVRAAALGRGRARCCCVRAPSSICAVRRRSSSSSTSSARSYVFLAAAKVGGIEANDSHPAEFLRDNLVIQTNVIDAAYRHGVAQAAVPRLELHLSASMRRSR